MAKLLRIEYAGAFYHVTARGNERWGKLFLLCLNSRAGLVSLAYPHSPAAAGLGPSRVVRRVKRVNQWLGLIITIDVNHVVH